MADRLTTAEPRLPGLNNGRAPHSRAASSLRGKRFAPPHNGTGLVSMGGAASIDVGAAFRAPRHARGDRVAGPLRKRGRDVVALCSRSPDPPPLTNLGKHFDVSTTVLERSRTSSFVRAPRAVYRWRWMWFLGQTPPSHMGKIVSTFRARTAGRVERFHRREALESTSEGLVLDRSKAYGAHDASVVAGVGSPQAQPSVSEDIQCEVPSAPVCPPSPLVLLCGSLALASTIHSQSSSPTYKGSARGIRSHYIPSQAQTIQYHAAMPDLARPNVTSVDSIQCCRIAAFHVNPWPGACWRSIHPRQAPPTAAAGCAASLVGPAGQGIHRTVEPHRTRAAKALKGRDVSPLEREGWGRRCGGGSGHDSSAKAPLVAGLLVLKAEESDENSSPAPVPPLDIDALDCQFDEVEWAVSRPPPERHRAPPLKMLNRQPCCVIHRCSILSERRGK
ncbi:hypothetical protein Purlil1_12334 [Purpureocillium lilacinum]|uniref:Uncharacterized protein n=1 Tax=Purpureocillium lilacinum TaxID=33203 RepID=A0ABR0BHS4_PURLI|nr:hypothetical protein Purlil1_12334 [Purpureocillium lilacinum]